MQANALIALPRIPSSVPVLITLVHSVGWAWLAYANSPGIAIVFAIPVAVWLFWAPPAFRIIRMERGRNLVRSVRFALWALTVLWIVGLLACRSVMAGRYVDEAASAVEKYRAIHGRYPIDLPEAGVAYGGVERYRWQVHYWPRREGPPVLMYAGQFFAMHRCLYDFADHRYVCID